MCMENLGSAHIDLGKFLHVYQHIASIAGSSNLDLCAIEGREHFGSNRNNAIMDLLLDYFLEFNILLLINSW